MGGVVSQPCGRCWDMRKGGPWHRQPGILLPWNAGALPSPSRWAFGLPVGSPQEHVIWGGGRGRKNNGTISACACVCVCACVCACVCVCMCLSHPYLLPPRDSMAWDQASSERPAHRGHFAFASVAGAVCGLVFFCSLLRRPRAFPKQRVRATYSSSNTS